MNTTISFLVITILVIIFRGRISSKNQETILMIVVTGVTSSASGEDHVPHLCRKSVLRWAAPKARRIDKIKMSTSLKPIKEIMNGDGMVGHCRVLVTLVRPPTDHVHRDFVCVGIGANSFVSDDVLLPKRITYGWFLDKSHTEVNCEKYGSQSDKKPDRTLSLEELAHGRKPCINRTWKVIRFDGVAIVLFQRLKNVHVIGMHSVPQR